MAIGYFRDEHFQTALLKFLCRDPAFLKDYGHMLKPEDFTPRKGETEVREQLAEIALGYWNEYKQPVGGMLRTEVLDFCQQEDLGDESTHKLLRLAHEIQSSPTLVAAEAMGRRVKDYKEKRARQQIVQQMIDAEEKGELTNEQLLRIAHKIYKNFGEQHQISDYSVEVEKRVLRRAAYGRVKWPYLMIPCIDERVRLLAPGMLGLLLAQYKVGKSVALAWITYAYAIQGLNVLYYTLEDPVTMVEDRLDSLVTGVAMKDLIPKSARVVRKFVKAKGLVRGRVKIIDGTEGGMSISAMEAIWDRQRDMGFRADAVVVDYDDEIEPPQVYKNKDNSRRFEFADIYREFRRWMVRKNTIGWTAAQAKRGDKEEGGENQKIVSGRHTAEDISKIRKVALCIGIGRNKPLGKDARHLYIAAHKYDESRIGFDIIGDYGRAQFYNDTATQILHKKQEAERKLRRARRK